MQNFGQHLQPFIIVVGATWKELTDFYICIDRTTHKRNSVLECFNLLFKCFHVYDVSYPVESEMIWNIISEFLYNKKSTIRNSTVSAVLNELKIHRESQDTADVHENRDVENIDQVHDEDIHHIEITERKSKEKNKKNKDSSKAAREDVDNFINNDETSHRKKKKKEEKEFYCR